MISATESNNVLFTLKCTTNSSVLLLCVVQFNMNKTLGGEIASVCCTTCPKSSSEIQHSTFIGLY